ncbi:MAG: outer membrane beta-barrel family protein [Sediminibacterium sp.]|nr:outer membrane beta-barrel family protein [Sediminibacterium sp.]MDP3128983.1 outer membrane beta-barrel family protein [Sediminibacterium sp.]
MPNYHGSFPLACHLLFVRQEENHVRYACHSIFMRIIANIITFILLTLTASAQTTGTVKGKLVDSLNKQSLKDASIIVLDGRDSSLEVFALAKADGSFTIANISMGAKIIQVKFQGYEPYSKHILFSQANANMDLGIIYLRTASRDLGNVTVTQSVIQMKKDTMEISASAFKTKPNAVAEDLLKKIPGMEVAKDGSVKSQGESVQRVLVDGKRFFGDDPRMATRNLPPDVIDKIQVFDDLSDQSKFTGFDDGNRVKTINITTKKDKRKGYFGKLVLGVGTAGNYDESVSINRFNGNDQLSLVAQANDINKQNFTQQNLGGGRGGGNFSGSGGSGSGITTTWASGLNYRSAWTKDIDAYGSYFYNNPGTATDQVSFIQNIVNKDSSTYNNRSAASVSKNANHRINFNFEDRIDSNNTVIFRPNITFQANTPNASSSTVTTAGTHGVLINQSTSKTSGSYSGYTISGANLQFRHRFAKKFRTASLDLNFSASENNGDGFNYAINSFYKPFVKTDTINQYYRDTSRNFTISPTFSYTEPIAKNQVLEFRYTYSYTNNHSIKNTYRFEDAAQKFSMFDSLFSNSYEYKSVSNTANLGYRLQHAKYNLNIGTGLEYTDLTSNNTTKNVLVTRNFVNLRPTVNFTYNYTKTKILRINYNGRTGQPGTTQLQPIITTSDSINFQVGNPNLKPQFTNSLRVLYTSFDPVTQRIIFATINASATGNDIQSSIIQNPNGGKTTTYANLGGTYTISGYFNYGFPLKKPKSNLSFQTNINYNQTQSLLNTKSNFTYNTGLAETIRWTTNLSSHFDMNLSASSTYTIARNSLQTAQNLNYYTQVLSAELTYYDTKGWIVSGEFDYTYNGNRSAGYNTSVPLWSPSIAKQFLKNKAGEIRLSCFDLLNQNVSVTRTVSTNQVIDTKTNTLTRYFMLTFTYNLRNFAGQQQRMPGMMRGMFGKDTPPPPGIMGGFGGGGSRNH